MRRQPNSTKAGWAMAVAGVGTSVAAFTIVGPFAVLYLALLFTAMVFGTLALMAIRQAFRCHALDDGL